MSLSLLACASTCAGDIQMISVCVKKITIFCQCPVIHGVRKAIIDALYNNSKEEWDKAEPVLYTTLYPDNIDAQMICEVGIGEVVYLENKYKDRDFVKASKKILEDVKCR